MIYLILTTPSGLSIQVHLTATEGLPNYSKLSGETDIVLKFWYHVSSVIRQGFFFQSNPKDLDPFCKTDLDPKIVFK